MSPTGPRSWGTHLDSLDTPAELLKLTAAYRGRRRKVCLLTTYELRRLLRSVHKERECEVITSNVREMRSLLCRADEMCEELLQRITVLEDIIRELRRPPTRDPGGTP